MSSTDSDRSVRKAAIIMFVYAALLVGGGVWAFVMAPEGAKAGTALFSSGASALLMIVCGVGSLLIRRLYVPGMIAIHVGMLLPLLFGVTFAWRAGESFRASGRYEYAEARYREFLMESGGQVSPDGMTVYLEDLSVQGNKDAGIKAVKLPDHDKAYAGNMLTGLFGISVAAFTALVLSRPKVPKAPPKPAPEAPAAGPSSSDDDGPDADAKNPA